MTPTYEKNLQDLEHFTLLVYRQHKDLFENKKDYIFSCRWLKLKYTLQSKSFFRCFRLFLQLLLMSPLHTFYRFYRSLPNLSRNIQFSRFARNI